MKWFKKVCELRGEKSTPQEVYHVIVRKNFRGKLKPPFNTEARLAVSFVRQREGPDWRDRARLCVYVRETVSKCKRCTGVWKGDTSRCLLCFSATMRKMVYLSLF